MFPPVCVDCGLQMAEAGQPLLAGPRLGHNVPRQFLWGRIWPGGDGFLQDAGTRFSCPTVPVADGADAGGNGRLQRHAAVGYRPRRVGGR